MSGLCLLRFEKFILGCLPTKPELYPWNCVLQNIILNNCIKYDSLARHKSLTILVYRHLLNWTSLVNFVVEDWLNLQPC
jgi:hypothetical protein